MIIIAEAGVNHNGDMDIAHQLVDAAASAGADYVKFQTFVADSLVAKHAEKADYQKANTGSSESQYEMIKKLELNYSSHLDLISYCEQKNIRFLSTPFDIESTNLLVELGLNLLKIPSGEITNLPYLRHIGHYNKQLIMSTGMAQMNEIRDAVSILKNAGTSTNKISVLHCNTEYPTPMIDVNLSAMISMKKTLELPVGYSDHTIGIEVPIAAVAMGATIVEKHFTLDRGLPGPDHRASLEPDELSSMVKAIRNIEMALGDGIKQPSRSEIRNISIARKSIVASKPIKAGEQFTEHNLGTKRPGHGISPMEWDNIMGKTATRNYETDDLIK